MFGRALRYAFLNPIEVMNTVPASDRWFAIDRLPLTIPLIVSFLFLAVRLRKQPQNERTAIALIAIASKVLLILFDPSPYQYVYGYALVPMAFAVAQWFPRAPDTQGSGPPKAPLVIACMALLAIALPVYLPAIAYILVKGRQPPAGSSLRLTLEAPLEAGQVENMSDLEILNALVSGERQHSLMNQIVIRSEVCRRVRGPVLSVIHAHPICLRDASSQWSDGHWPAILQGEGPNMRAGAWNRAEMIRRLRSAPPKLFLWRRPTSDLDKRSPQTWLVDELRRCHRIPPGYALLRPDSPCARGTPPSASGQDPGPDV